MTSESQGDTDPVAALRAAVDVMVFAPLGLGVKLVDDGPEAVRRIRQELSNARFIGRMAVDRGVQQARERTSSVVAPPGDRPPTETAPAPGPEPDPEVRQKLQAAVEVTASETAAPDVAPGDLALPDYDQLPAIDIVAKLASLTPEERAAIGAHESANRRRRTVIGKIRQLADDA